MTQTLNRHDDDLKAAVTAELRWTPTINSTNIGIAVDQGAVTLSGEVDSYPELLLATQAAQRVRGVTAVAQEITVHTEWSNVNDTDIAREAGKAVDRAVDVPDAVQVKVHDHYITLSGVVTWEHERLSAARTVRYIKGVRGVINQITIRPAVAADGIQKGISLALVRSAQGEGRNIKVTADHKGVVTLDGTVGSWSERRLAERTSWSAPGVTGIVDHLTIND